jgi:hypothetical protein
MSSSKSDNSNDSRFRPGQLGLKHLLAVLAIVSVVMACAAAQLRTQPLLGIGEFFLYWLIVGVLAGSLYYARGISLRRDRASAGDLLLQANHIHLTESKRRFGCWTMLLAAIGSAILVSLYFLPQGLLAMLDSRPRFAFAVVFGEGLLWAICLELWLTRSPPIEFRERGILCLGRYFCWESITRIGWSTMKNGNLVFSSGSVMHDLPIDPAVRDEVDAILKARATGPPAEPGRP